jgi:hypothetical protein
MGVLDAREHVGGETGEDIDRGVTERHGGDGRDGSSRVSEEIAER